MVAVTQKKAFKPGTYRGQNLTALRLRQYAEGTNKALAAGVPIPGLKKHAKVSADDKETEQSSATDGAGWLKGVEIDDDGAIGWNLDVPKEIADGVTNGTIRFTSPEFRDNYQASDGRYSGPIIRHVAFTPLPKAHDQGPLVLAMSEGVFQFGEDDYEGPPKKDGDGDGEKGEGESKVEGAKEPKNPDMPPVATDSTKLAAFVAGMAQLGVVLPSDFDLAADSALDLLITGINTQCKAKADAEADNSKEPQEPELKESQDSAMPFSEDDIKALMPPLQAKARKANDDAKAAHEKAVQFSEERKATTREKVIAKVKSEKLPAGLKGELLACLDAVQFSETDEVPTLTVQRAAAMFSKAVPQLTADDEGAEVVHKDGEQFYETEPGAVSAEQAEATARRIHSRDKTKK